MMCKKIEDSKKHNVPVVSEDILEAFKKGPAAMMIADKRISDWGAEVSQKLVLIIMEYMRPITSQ